MLSGSVFHLGSYRLDSAKRELWCGDTAIALTPQVFDCLTYLITHRDRAVGKDELIAAVWGRADVNDTLLGQTIMHARRAVGDDGTAQRAIRTIPRFGYRWVDDAIRVGTDDGTQSVPDRELSPQASSEPQLPVEPTPIVLPGRPEATPGEDEATERPMSPRIGDARRPWLSLAAVALVLLAVSLAAAMYLFRADAPAPMAQGPSLALNPQLVLVVPAGIAPGNDTAWVPLGIMDSVAGQLRERGWPVVPSVTAVALGSREGQEHGVLVEASGAGVIVHPQVEKDGSTWRVRLDLRGRKDLPPRIDASDTVLLDAARLAGDRLFAVLQKQPLPDLVQRDPDFAASQLVQQVEAELLAGRFTEAGHLLTGIPESLAQRPEVRLQAATLDYRAGRLEQAAKAFHALLSDLPPESPPQWRARTLIGLGSVARTRARFAEAKPYYEQAIALLEPLSQPDLSGIAYAYLGISLSGLGRFDDAMAALSRARMLLESIGDAYSIAMVDSTHAAVLADRRRLTEAVPRMEQAIARFEQLGMTKDALGQSLALAQMYRELLEHEAALAASSQAWDAYAQQSTDRLYPIAAATQIRALVEVGRMVEAGRVFGAIQRNNEPLDRGYQWDQLRLAIADWRLQAGQLTTAESGYADVIAAAALPVESGWAWLSWLRTLRVLDRSEQLEDAYTRATQWAATVDKEEGDGLVYVRLIEAERQWNGGDRQLAQEHYAASLSRAEARGVPALTAMVAISYSRALIADRRLDEAASVVGRVATWADRDYDCALLQAEFYRAAGDRRAWERALAQARTLAGERVVPERLNTLEAVSRL